MRVLFIVEDGVDDLELYYAYYRAKEEGWQPIITSHSKYTNRLVFDENTGSYRREDRSVVGKRGVTFSVDKTYREALSEAPFDALIIPGGRSPERARLHREAVELVKLHFESFKPILAICHGPLLLASAGALKGLRVTGHPGIGDDLRNAGAIYTGSEAEVDRCIVTTRHTTTIHEGMKLFIKLVSEGCLRPY
ncbi:MAG: DJ-1/PfpI family protein [Desulfurococcales archaeon]|nr:DJ-1/PfpI family protein [Desulfurococcales archaeon]